MRTLFTMIATGLLVMGSQAAQAGEAPDHAGDETIVISIVTDDFVIEDADLSRLSVGDAETFVTDSGKTVDMLRTEDGIEVYVDGELIEGDDMQDEKHIVHKIRIVCDDEGEECGEDMTWVEGLEDVEIDSLHEHGQKFIVIAGEGGDIDIEQLSESAHEVHGTVHIVKEIDVEVLEEVHELHGDGEREVVIIKKKVGDEI